MAGLVITPNGMGISDGKLALAGPSGLTCLCCEEAPIPACAQVTPTDRWIVTGCPGGPFDATSRIYTIKNNNPFTINWKWIWIDFPDPVWFESPDPTEGTLGPGQETTIVFQLTPAAYLLDPTIRHAKIHFVKVPDQQFCQELQFTLIIDSDGNCNSCCVPIGSFASQISGLQECSYCIDDHILITITPQTGLAIQQNVPSGCQYTQFLEGFGYYRTRLCSPLNCNNCGPYNPPVDLNANFTVSLIGHGIPVLLLDIIVRLTITNADIGAQSQAWAKFNIPCGQRFQFHTLSQWEGGFVCNSNEGYRPGGSCSILLLPG